MATAKPNQKIHVDKLQTTLEKLEQLEKKQPLEVTLRESIYFLRDKLRSALKKGYSYEDLSEILEVQGILISAATLKQYLTEINKETAKGKRGSKSGGLSKQSDSKATEKTITKKVESTVGEDKEQVKEGLSKSELENIKSKTQATDTKISLESEVELSQENNQLLPRESQQGTSKSVRGKTKKLSGNSTDLASEFNEY